LRTRKLGAYVHSGSAVVKEPPAALARISIQHGAQTCLRLVVAQGNRNSI